MNAKNNFQALFLQAFFGRPFVSDRCLSCPSRLSVLSVLCVTLVYCVQTVEWIKMKLGVHVGLGPGHIVLDGDPSPLPQRGTAPEFSANFGPCLLWPNGWMDEDATWYGSRPRPRPHCVRRGPRSPSPVKTAQQPPTLFGPWLLWPCTVAHLSYC